ncbi:hypothetical protein K474DRAFT_1714259 [Panus rudis PR-1116 ss-1]|nr:hypothetical protein K474DRAFT_1714259 [Panus rudis PR-1116 ss-1]
MHFYAWQRGLKTGMYYLRSKPASTPLPFTLPNASTHADDANDHPISTSILSCGVQPVGLLSRRPSLLEIWK